MGEYIMNICKTIRFSSVRPKEMVILCDRKVNVKMLVIAV
jgi:hypothetical protein